MISTDGSFRAGDLLISRALTLDAFEVAPARAGARMNYHGHGVSVRLDGRDVLGRPAIVGLEFRAGSVERAWICLRLPGDGKDWSDWTLEQEMARKRAHDELAFALFGAALTLRPMDVGGKPVLPLFPGPEYPNHARFTWGEVVSGYDSKGGAAEMWISYRTRDVDG